jgi:hypothetical protein
MRQEIEEERTGDQMRDGGRLCSAVVWATVQ